MNDHTQIGTNRTGMGTSPMDGATLVNATKKTMPTAAGDENAIAANRIRVARESEPLGTMPPPATMKGAAKTIFQAVKGMNANAYIDKLAERLAFERMGTRLYDAIISKFDATGSWPGGPSRKDLAEHRREELAHFEMVREAILQLGADPTAMTPSADLKAVASAGILQVITDPRTDLFQCLDAMLTAELTDNDAWEMLIQLSLDMKQDRLAKDFEEALVAERRHLEHVRAWVSARMGELLSGRPSAPPRGSRATSRQTAVARKGTKTRTTAKRTKSARATKGDGNGARVPKGRGSSARKGARRRKS